MKLRRDATAAEKKAYRAAYFQKRKEEIRVQRRGYYARNPQVFKRGAKKYEAANRLTINTMRRKYTAAHPEQRLWSTAKHRAKKNGVSFTIVASDIRIPKVCPVLGIELSAGTGRMCAASPSIDRFDSSKGYVLGNVAVISWRANCIKHNATPAELRAVAAWVSR